MESSHYQVKNLSRILVLILHRPSSALLAVKPLKKSWNEKVKQRKEKEMLAAFQKEVRSGLAEEKKV
jgi:hypothetical protein